MSRQKLGITRSHHYRSLEIETQFKFIHWTLQSPLQTLSIYEFLLPLQTPFPVHTFANCGPITVKAFSNYPLLYYLTVLYYKYPHSLFQCAATAIASRGRICSVKSLNIAHSLIYPPLTADCTVIHYATYRGL